MLETRTIKNVCAPAAVIEDKIYIIGGEWRSKDSRLIEINSKNILYISRLCMQGKKGVGLKENAASERTLVPFVRSQSLQEPTFLTKSTDFSGHLLIIQPSLQDLLGG